MSDDAPPKKDPPAGLPGWVMTFADLMSLLMCFFVLLLSFSQMDLKKFKQVAGSMEKAFGVQREIKASEIPKGTSIIAKEFSPGKPQPTAIQQIRQQTVNDNFQTVQFDYGDSSDRARSEENNRKTMDAAKSIAQILEESISAGLIEVEVEGSKLIIRVLERGLFPQGSADIWPDMTPVLSMIAKALSVLEGRIVIAGHTDNARITETTSHFKSNWELSAARAVSVAQELFEEGDENFERVTVIGYADTKPKYPNDTKKHRALNRRVEITLDQGKPDEVSKEPVKFDGKQ